MDLHAWVVHRNGSIYDPYFSFYDHCKKVWGCEQNAPTLYDELNGDEKKQAWREIWKRFIRPLVQTSDVDELFREYVKKPVPGRCFLNAWAYHQLNPGTLYKIGKMGWPKKGGDVHWEYG